MNLRPPLHEAPPPPSSLAPASPSTPWLNYEHAAAYTGFSVRYLRNLVSAEAIPVYGGPRSRRFRRDMLDLYLTDRGAAMRRFRLERQAQRGN